MRLPPSLAGIQVQPPHRWFPRIWIPLFLLWPLLLLLAIPVAIVALLLGSRGIAAGAAAWDLLCEMRGTLVDVEGNDGAKVFVRIY